MNEPFWDWIAMGAAVMLPLWNVPLVHRVIKRRSSQDISLLWVLGVWICFLAMLPSALHSDDAVWRVFSILNIVCFTAVVVTVLWFRQPNKSTRTEGHE